MLKIIEYGKDEYDFPCLIVLGCFDALHEGHCELLKKAALQAKINGLDLGVMMFAGGKGGKLIYTFDERLALLESFKVKFVLKIDYTDELRNTPAKDFLNAIDRKINVKGYMSGKDFRFGAGAKGKSSTLKSYADDEENGVWYQSVKDVMFNDVKISTTLIKSMLKDGDISTANRLLTRNYSITGTVVHGAERGAGVLGYPTMNIVYPEDKTEIKQGVYAVNCNVGGTVFRGIANYGACPTFGDTECRLEVHLDGFEGENYGDTVNVEFVGYLRDTEKFETVDELKARLDVDMEAIRREND